jgi:hypothetical protein
MENKNTRWGVLALIAFITLLLAALLLPPLPKAKARAMRIRAENRVVNFSAMMPITNAPPTATTNK